ncbi:DUF4097 family beta strand repeat-containing protein [Lysobacter sp. A421]
MRKILLGCVLMLPLVAFAQQKCEHTRAFELSPDLAGIETVVFEVGAFDLDVKAATGASAQLQGKACASSAKKLEQLQFRHQRHGDRLVVSMDSDGNGDSDGWQLSLFGNNYAYMQLTATLPDDVAVQVDTGSGDADIDGVASLDLVVGSGDADVRRVPGSVSVVVGSGDAELADIGPLEVGSVGSGDLEASDVAGDVKIGSIGSGDIGLARVEGNVQVGTIGSGSLDVDTVSGDLRVRSIGSGDVNHRGVKGTVDLPRR